MDEYIVLVRHHDSDAIEPCGYYRRLHDAETAASSWRKFSPTPDLVEVIRKPTIDWSHHGRHEQ